MRQASVSNEVQYAGYSIRELESGTIEIARGGQIIQPAKPVLRELVVQLNVGLLNSKGNVLNTRSLVTQIILACGQQEPRPRERGSRADQCLQILIVLTNRVPKESDHGRVPSDAAGALDHYRNLLTDRITQFGCAVLPVHLQA